MSDSLRQPYPFGSHFAVDTGVLALYRGHQIQAMRGVTSVLPVRVLLILWNRHGSPGWSRPRGPKSEAIRQGESVQN